MDENGFLIATDVAARGLDIPNVEHVIHYQVPRTSEVTFNIFNNIIIQFDSIKRDKKKFVELRA